MKAHLHQRWHVAKLISLRGLRSGLQGAVLPFCPDLRFPLRSRTDRRQCRAAGTRKGFLPYRGHLTYPFFSVVYILAFTLLWQVRLAIVRDRDRGTMETLFAPCGRSLLHLRAPF